MGAGCGLRTKGDHTWIEENFRENGACETTGPEGYWGRGVMNQFLCSDPPDGNISRHFFFFSGGGELLFFQRRLQLLQDNWLQVCRGPGGGKRGPALASQSVYRLLISFVFSLTFTAFCSW